MSKIKIFGFFAVLILGAGAWFYFKSGKATVTHEQTTTPMPGEREKPTSPAARVDSDETTPPPIGGTFEKKDTPKPAKKADTPATWPAVTVATATTAKVEKKTAVSSRVSKLFHSKMNGDAVAAKFKELTKNSRNFALQDGSLVTFHIFKNMGSYTRYQYFTGRLKGFLDPNKKQKFALSFPKNFKPDAMITGCFLESGTDVTFYGGLPVSGPQGGNYLEF